MELESNKELQSEEKEVINSIYDGDTAFKQITPITYQYKYGEEGDTKSFILEIIWNENYPSEKPDVNLDIFYNKHLQCNVKEKIKNFVLKEAESWIGSAMTYTLFESIKENLNDLIADQPESPVEGDNSNDCPEDNNVEIDKISKSLDKKVQLTKAQKRKQWDRVEMGGKGGEKPRGWNWVDIVQHLSQTGLKT